MTDMQKIVAEIEATHDGEGFDYRIIDLMDEHWPALRAALLASPAVPDGYVLVPREPTEAMLSEGGDELCDSNAHSYPNLARAVYDAMLSAAPKPPTQGWQPIDENTPSAAHFLVTYWHECEWIVGVAMNPLPVKWTHWMPLPTPPAVEGE